LVYTKVVNAGDDEVKGKLGGGESEGVGVGVGMEALSFE